MKKVKKKNRIRARSDDWMILDEKLSAAAGKKLYTLLPEKEEVISQWARNGLTKEEIASNMLITRSTLDLWTKKCPGLSDALKNARAYAHARVENALFKKAVGFTIIKMQPVKRRCQDYDGVGKKIGEHEEIELVEVREEVPPDMGAIAFYLKNNMPQKYKDKWPDVGTENDEEAGRVCLKVFAKAVAAAGGADSEP